MDLNLNIYEWVTFADYRVLFPMTKLALKIILTRFS